MSQAPHPTIRAFFDEPTNTISYLVADPVTPARRSSIPCWISIIATARSSAFGGSHSGRRAKQGLTIEWVLETHAHADHLSGAPYIKSKTGARIGIGEHIQDVQRTSARCSTPTDLRTDGSDFDRLFADGETFGIGELDVEVLHTPGHTPADMSLQDRRCRVRRRHAVHAGLRHRARRFSGRRRRVSSIARSSGCCAADETRLFMCHDYKAPGPRRIRLGNHGA